MSEPMPPGHYEPVRVHLESSDVPLGSPRPRRCRRALRTNIFTLTAAQPTQRILPQADARAEAWLTSIVAEEVYKPGFVSVPAAHSAIVTLPVLPAGWWNITVYAGFGGTAEATTPNNWALVSGATTVVPAIDVALATNTQTNVGTFPVYSDGTSNITLQNPVAASASAFYQGALLAVPASSPGIWIASSQADAASQAGGAAQISGTGAIPFPVNTTDAVWASASLALPVTVSVLAIYEQYE